MTSDSQRKLNRNEKWMQHYKVLLHLSTEYGGCCLPTRCIVRVPDGIGNFHELNLGSWLREQRRAFHKQKLQEDRRNLLQQLVDQGQLLWNPPKHKQMKDDPREWENIYSIIEKGEHYMNKKTLKKARDWMSMQRALHKKGRLSNERIKKLDNLVGKGYFQWHKGKNRTDDEHWNLRFQLLLMYGENNGGDCNVPTDYIVESYNSIAPTNLHSPDSVSQIPPNTANISQNQSTMSSSADLYAINTNVQQIQFSHNFISDNILIQDPTASVPSTPQPADTPSFINPGNRVGVRRVRLGLWLSRQRQLRRVGSLREDRRLKLQELVDADRLLWHTGRGSGTSTPWDIDVVTGRKPRQKRKRGDSADRDQEGSSERGSDSELESNIDEDTYYDSEEGLESDDSAAS